MIVVTGGAGFIGSNLVAALNARGEREVVVCDRLRQGEKWRNLAKRSLADVVPPDQLIPYLDRHAGQVRTVFHLGAISATTATDGDLVINTNFRFSLDLWDWCARHGVPFIYASSAATYGDGEQGFCDDNSRDALARLRPLNLYGWSKHLFDLRVREMVDTGQPCPPQWAGLKFFNVFGPNEAHKAGMQSVVAKAYPQIAHGQPARLFKSHRDGYADGGQLRDFIWVGDVVNVMLWLADHREVSGIFNVGTGVARSFADLIGAIFTALDLPKKIQYIDMPEELRGKYQYFTQADMSRLTNAGYDQLFTSLENAVGIYVRNYLSAPDPYI